MTENSHHRSHKSLNVEKFVFPLCNTSPILTTVSLFEMLFNPVILRHNAQDTC
jgi:hypothetical protein